MITQLYDLEAEKAYEEHQKLLKEWEDVEMLLRELDAEVKKALKR